MILGPVSLLDCLVAGLILAPQLLWTTGLLATLRLIFATLPLVCKYRLARIGPQSRWPGARLMSFVTSLLQSSFYHVTS